MNLDSTENRKGVSTIEQQLHIKIAELNFKISQLESTILSQKRLLQDCMRSKVV